MTDGASKVALTTSTTISDLAYDIATSCEYAEIIELIKYIDDHIGDWDFSRALYKLAKNIIVHDPERLAHS